MWFIRETSGKVGVRGERWKQPGREMKSFVQLWVQVKGNGKPLKGVIKQGQR